MGEELSAQHVLDLFPLRPPRVPAHGRSPDHPPAPLAADMARQRERLRRGCTGARRDSRPYLQASERILVLVDLRGRKPGFPKRWLASPATSYFAAAPPGPSRKSWPRRSRARRSSKRRSGMLTRKPRVARFQLTSVLESFVPEDSRLTPFLGAGCPGVRRLGANGCLRGGCAISGSGTLPCASWAAVIQNKAIARSGHETVSSITISDTGPHRIRTEPPCRYTYASIPLFCLWPSTAQRRSFPSSSS